MDTETCIKLKAFAEYNDTIDHGVVQMPDPALYLWHVI